METIHYIMLGVFALALAPFVVGGIIHFWASRQMEKIYLELDEAGQQELRSALQHEYVWTPNEHNERSLKEFDRIASKYHEKN